MEFDESIVEEFVAESREHLESIEEDLLALEKSGGKHTPEQINGLFRAIHTVKGASGFLGFTRLAELTHAAETLLSMIRAGEIESSPQIIDSLLRAVDKVSAMMDDIANSNEADVADILASLQQHIEAEASEEVQAELDTTIEASATKDKLERFDLNLFELKNLVASHDHIYLLQYDLNKISKETGENPLFIINTLEEVGEIVKATVDAPADDLREELSDKPLHYSVLFGTMLGPEMLMGKLGLPESNISEINKEDFLKDISDLSDTEEGKSETAEAVDSSAESEGREGAEEINDEAVEVVTESAKTGWDGTDRRGAKPDAPTDRKKETVRIKLNTLDELMRLAGELVLVRNQQLISGDKSDPIARANMQKLDIVTSELQESVMATRMQPVGNLFSKFPRIVRDLGKKLSKKIEIDISGSNVELDNTILENLSDPLTHLIRNSCDHGVGTPAERKKVGKPEVGKISLLAYHESGQINIEIRDDGKGISPKAMKKAAFEKGLKTKAELDQMSDKDVVSLITYPGFSTAKELSDVSGRGVGMDVVKTSIEGLGGTLDIDSKFGKGTIIYMRLPLTLAIIPCLLVMVGDHRYAIPQVNLEELVCLYDKDVKNKIESAGNKEVYRLRDQLLPMVRLEELLNRPEAFTDEVNSGIAEKYRLLQEEKSNDDKGSNPESMNFAVLKVGTARFGLIVDTILGTEEIVVKPMHPSLNDLHCYAGATVMGDGKVAMILDPQGVARHVGISLEGKVEDESNSESALESDMQTVLLFKNGDVEQFAMPLPIIQRIESVSVSQMEKIGGKNYITIDGVSTLVLTLDNHLNVSPCVMNERMYLILPKHMNNPFGILVSQLIDAIEVTVKLNAKSYKEKGLLGTAIINDQMTLFIDIHGLIEKAQPEWFEKDESYDNGNQEKRILLVEDSSFYRELVKESLEADGYEVTIAVNGQDGLDKTQKEDFDLVVSDLEMPVMDGWTFMEQLRANPKYSDTPTIALTALDTELDRERAAHVGFTRYETKLDKYRLLASVTEIFSALRNRTSSEEVA